MSFSLLQGTRCALYCLNCLCVSIPSKVDLEKYPDTYKAFGFQKGFSILVLIGQKDVEVIVVLRR